jgi:acyl carrier protein
MSETGGVYERVVRVLVESLNVEEEEVTPQATLQGDLGAESIDFLDIVFRLEREFGIHIPRGELFPESIFEGNAELVQDGRVTDKGMGELAARMPYADLNGFDRDRRLTAVSALFTVDVIARYIDWKLGPNGGDSLPVDATATPARRDVRHHNAPPITSEALP